MGEELKLPDDIPLMCGVCGEETESSRFCGCGAGPLCERCWRGHSCAERHFDMVDRLEMLDDEAREKGGA